MWADSIYESEIAMNQILIKNEYTNIDWLKANHTKIHYFGLGFIQLKLTPEFRLHFYTKKLPAIVGDEDIHDHRYYFSSHVLKGTFNQKIFQMRQGDDYELEYDSCQEGCKPEKIGECSFKLLTLSNYSAGSGYYIDENTFHQVFSDDAITLIYRPHNHTKPKARVAHKKGTPKVCPFSKKVPEEVLWEIVKEML